MRSLAGWLGLVVIATLIPGQVAHSSASAQRKADPDDAQSPLDLKDLRLNYKGGRFILTVDTYGNWRSRKLSGPGSWISARFSRRQASEPRRLLTIDFKHGDLVAKIENTAKGAPAPTVARPDPKRPDRNTLRVSFSKDAWGRLGKRIFWGVTIQRSCSDCYDAAPDDASYFRYKL